MQENAKIGVDGEFGEESLHALEMALNAAEPPTEARHVSIDGGDCWVRSAPNTGGERMGAAKCGEAYNFGGQSDTDDRGRVWYLIEYKNKNGWVSSAYGKLV